MTTFPSTSPLAPFRVRSYRFQWPADLLTSWAMEMEVIILAWYILVETESVLLLTVYGALNFGGTLISPILGTVSDLWERWRPPAETSDGNPGTKPDSAAQPAE